MIHRVFFVLLIWILGLAYASAVEPETPSSQDDKPFPTFGGMQLWGDELHFHGWRIQRNALTGHCRLLDERDWRHVSGTFDECRNRLDEIAREKSLAPMRGKVVIVLHGLGRARLSMAPVCKYLEKNSKFTVISVSYPTTRGEVGDHARRLASIIENLPEVEEINFVAHSLGNLVIRHYLADHTDPATDRKPDPRIKRFVMLGPPNNGAQLAETFDSELFNAIIGATAPQMGKGWQALEPKLATPQCEFGIIAGGRGTDTGFNPILPGDDDFIVTVDSARLPGACDFLLVPVMHSFLMYDPDVQKHTLRFLEEGCFVAPGKRQPIELSAQH